MAADHGAGLRGLVGAGRSRVSVSAAMRVRDRGRPDAADLEAAEREIDRRLAARTPGGRPAAAQSRLPRPRVARPPEAPAPRGTAGDGRATPTPAEVDARHVQGSGGSSPSAS